MSVTFAPHVESTSQWALSCVCCECVPTIYPDYASAAAVHEAFLSASTHPDAHESGTLDPVPTHDGAPTLNVTSTNGRYILDALGIVLPATAELWGEMTGTDLLGRVLVALAIAPADTGTPAHTLTGHRQATVVMCGRRPGYLQDALGVLRDIAEWAITHQTPVVWG